MKINYIRVSTQNQNISRQEKKGFDKTFIDRCSGSIPFFERPQGLELFKFLKNNSDVEVSVQSVDRLGRGLLDVLKTIEYFKKHNWKLQIEDIGMNSHSPFFPLMVSLLGTLANHEREMIKERTRQGIEIAKKEGRYQGRKKGTKDTREKTLAKHKNIVKLLEKRIKIKDINTITGISRQTIYKIKGLV